jgi:hypothetical protein
VTPHQISGSLKDRLFFRRFRRPFLAVSFPQFHRQIFAGPLLVAALAG